MKRQPSKKYLTVIMMVIFIFVLSVNCFAYEPYETDHCWVQLSNVDEEGTIVTIYNESLDTKAFLLNYEKNSDTNNRELVLYGMAGNKKVVSEEASLETGVTYKIEKVDSDIIVINLSNDEKIVLSVSDSEAKKQLGQTDSMWKGKCYFDGKWENDDPFEVAISITGDDLPETTEAEDTEAEESTAEESTQETEESTEETSDTSEEETSDSKEESTEKEETSDTETSSSKTTITATGEGESNNKQTISQQKNIIRFLLIVIVVMAIIVTIMTIMVMKSTGADDDNNNHMADKVTRWKDTK